MEDDVARSRVRELVWSSIRGNYKSPYEVRDEALFRQSLALGAATLDVEEITGFLLSIEWDPAQLLRVLAGPDEARAAAEAAAWICDCLQDELEAEFRPRLGIAAPELLPLLQRCLDLTREAAAAAETAAVWDQLGEVLAAVRQQIEQKDEVLRPLETQVEWHRGGPGDPGWPRVDPALLETARRLATGGPITDGQRIAFLRRWVVVRPKQLLDEIGAAVEGARRSPRPIDDRFKARVRRLIAALCGPADDRAGS